MNRARRVLIVDDEERWRNEPASILRKDSFLVDTVENIQDALTKLNATFYHLLVLDIRMKDAEHDNVEGMQLLADLDKKRVGIGIATQVVMLTAHGTREHMRTAFAQHGVADFVPKDEFDNLEFLKLVNTLFTDKIHINLKLDIRWQQVAGPAEALLNLVIEDTRIKRNTSQQQQLAEELDDLLCRLFYRATSIVVKPLTPGMSGTGVLWVEPFYEAGGGQPVVVKFGDVQQIEEEYRRFIDYVEPFIGGGRTTKAQPPRRTMHLGGIVYSLVGTATEKLQSFGDFYQANELPAIREVIEHLFQDTCGKWYASPGKLILHDLTADYKTLLNLSMDKVELALQDKFKGVKLNQNQTLRFETLQSDRSFANPLLVINDRHFERATYVCNTHGDFNDSNLLIDHERHGWLIDFLRSGPGHILRDVAELDTTVRIRLLQPHEATLAERLHMEETLSGIERFSQVSTLESAFPTSNPALRKAFAVTVHLRKIAGRLVAQNPRDALEEYYIALLYYALNLTRFYAVPTIQREHALLTASLLAERISGKE